MRNLLLANESLQATRKSLTDAISVSIAAAQPIIAIVKALEETQLPAHKKMLRVELDALYVIVSGSHNYCAVRSQPPGTVETCNDRSGSMLWLDAR